MNKWNTFWNPIVPTVKNLETGEYEEYKGKVFNDPHLTEEADVMTMREIVRRAKAGTLSSNINSKKTFDSPIEQDLDSPDLEEMTRWPLDKLVAFEKANQELIGKAKEIVELKAKMKAEQEEVDKFNSAVDVEIAKRAAQSKEAE